ncbi:MAG: RNA-directed DNA polymerase [Lachnospiraceae bacterium]|nr:RNA-directed DNA polymerase [Lachnospiraceae bacterium]
MDFSNIYTRNDFADFLGIKRGKLTYILYIQKVDTMYSTFSIPKKNGGERIINAPNDDLKQIQRNLANALWKYQTKIWKGNNVHPNISHAFQKGKSIVTNSLPHKNKRFIVNIDLENFFDSFNFGRVRGYFIKNSYWSLTEEVATVIAQLTCHKGTLPQGAPSSPIIANMICNIMDIHLLGISKRYKLTYTRYADDMTFSTNDKHFLERYDNFYKELSKEVTKSGFCINKKKTRILYNNSRQEVTGLIVNNKLSIKREYYKATQAMAHSLYLNGEFTINGSIGTIQQLEGRFSFINQIEKYNNTHDGKEHSVRTLNRREKKYQELLFYKNFCVNPKPLIVTEGKTDILYLKSALKKMYLKYPSLIEKKDDKWIFKVSFLRRSNKLSYFFDFSLDGADAMQNIYNMYTGSGKMQVNYYKYFHEKYKTEMLNPVILLYDNEFIKDKPIKKFIGACKCDEKTLQQKLYLPLVGNLFVQIVPLVNSKQTCEIEDLFDDHILNLELSGRKFDRTGKANKKEFYNKDIFSKYILTHYENIDFSSFTPLFNALEKIISDYSTQKKF